MARTKKTSVQEKKKTPIQENCYCQIVRLSEDGKKLESIKGYKSTKKEA